MTITIQLQQVWTGRVGMPMHIPAAISSTNQISNITWTSQKRVNYSVSLDHRTLNFTPPYNGTFPFQIRVQAGPEVKTAVTYINVGTVSPSPSPSPSPTPIPTAGTLLYDSHLHSKLHNGIVRRFTAEGNLECRASGNPYIQVNADGTFSLWDSDLGRFYLYVNNYNVMMEIVFAFGQGNQTLSLKLRSRHNEGDPITNRFGGYGFAVSRTEYDAKREPYHNTHDEALSGSLGKNLGTGIYHTIQFSVKDMPKPVETAVLDGVRVRQWTDTNPQPYMVNPQLYAQRSYIWVRQNTTQLTENRIKSLKLLAI